MICFQIIRSCLIFSLWYFTSLFFVLPVWSLSSLFLALSYLWSDLFQVSYALFPSVTFLSDRLLVFLFYVFLAGLISCYCTFSFFSHLYRLIAFLSFSSALSDNSLMSLLYLWSELYLVSWNFSPVSFSVCLSFSGLSPFWCDLFLLSFSDLYLVCLFHLISLSLTHTFSSHHSLAYLSFTGLLFVFFSTVLLSLWSNLPLVPSDLSFSDLSLFFSLSSCCIVSVSLQHGGRWWSGGACWE